MLAWLLVESVADLADPANSELATSWFGLGPPLVMGVGILGVGVVVMVVRRVRHPGFWAAA